MLPSNTIKFSIIPTLPQSSRGGACQGGPSDNKRVDARHRRPAAVPRDLARASPALFADKVLTHKKHYSKSTPPLRKRPLAQKALRALWPWLGHAGSTKFGRPRKTQAFFGAPELRPRAGVVRKAARGTARLVRTISNHLLLRQYLFSSNPCAPIACHALPLNKSGQIARQPFQLLSRVNMFSVCQHRPPVARITNISVYQHLRFDNHALAITISVY
jgi:hypothetical protein